MERIKKLARVGKEANKYERRNKRIRKETGERGTKEKD